MSKCFHFSCYDKYKKYIHCASILPLMNSNLDQDIRPLTPIIGSHIRADLVEIAQFVLRVQVIEGPVQLEYIEHTESMKLLAILYGSMA